MDAIALPPGPTGVTPQDSKSAAKVLRAAQDFEALLLGSLLRSLEQTFSAVPGDAHVPGSDDYQYLGTQALASGLAASGGLGIADLIRNLMTNNGITVHNEGMVGTKVSSR
ncbi:MAG: rod-binding protein [Acidobacteriia bacterium]|nr:rod-binding protein [Terriglobia bacterium]